MRAADQRNDSQRRHYHRKISILLLLRAQFGFNITGTTHIPVVVEACTDLANPLWTPLPSLKLTNGLVYFSDAQWTNYPARYYRISAP